ncbi:hypothetical protein C0992_003921 [Termitomyces sp. T32_za158]|nr:hypothetical protein C0992_003921 [Termitomyces sp. T32_za158]
MHTDNNAPEETVPSPQTSGTFDEPAHSGQASGNVPTEVIRFTTEERKINEQLERIIEEFRREQRDKAQSISGIISVIGESTLGPKFKGDSVEHYLTLLNHIEKERGRRYARATEHEAYKGGRVEGERARDEPPEPDEFEPGNEDRQKRGKTVDFTRNQRDDLLGANRDSGSDTEHDSDEPSPKKRKIKESDLLWFEEEKSARSDEDPRCLEN